MGDETFEIYEMYIYDHGIITQNINNKIIQFKTPSGGLDLRTSNVVKHQNGDEIKYVITIGHEESCLKYSMKFSKNIKKIDNIIFEIHKTFCEDIKKIIYMF
jgi:hypothetical protein